MSSNSEALEKSLRNLEENFPRRWSLFFARYRLVTEITGLEFHSLKGSTARGYEIGVRLGLAYTALETLQKATGRQLPAVKDGKAARILRGLRRSEFETFIESTASSKKLRERLKSMFASQKIMDLMPLLEAIRHSVFHGSYTPKSSGFTKSAEVRLLLDLVFHLVVDLIEVELKTELVRLEQNL